MQRSAVKPEAHTQCLALLCSGGANLVYRQQVVTASTCYTNCVRFTALSSSPFLLLVLIDLILLLLQFVIIIAVLLLIILLVIVIVYVIIVIVVLVTYPVYVQKGSISF
jgi:hypothetical protein